MLKKLFVKKGENYENKRKEANRIFLVSDSVIVVCDGICG